MSSNSFPSTGDLFKVRISAGINSSTPCICNSQFNISTDCRRITSGASLDCENRVYSSLKQKLSHHNRLFHSSRTRTPLAAVRKAVEKTSFESSSSESSIPENHTRNELSALDAYFNKLQGKGQLKEEVLPSQDGHSKDAASDSRATVSETNSTPNTSAQNENAIRNDLQSVEIYLERFSKGLKKSSSPADNPNPEHELDSLMKDIAPSMRLASLQEVTDERDLGMEDPATSVGTESLVVYVLAAINIAVYLFGLASPVDTAGMGTSTLPLLYGAKVNEFLLNGEWWRLITPMFLHSGFFHVVLSSWALLFFGPQVENVFGPLAFCMIYFLGGLCGNMFSFFFTPAATVGGTGPLFALFSAWVVYLWQNKTALGEKSADYGIKATTLMGVLVVCLSCLLPTDEWIHVGAILPGTLFGAFASPSLQVGVNGNDSNAKNMESREGVVAIFDSPSVFSLALGFAFFTSVCFAVYYFATPMVTESQVLNNVPF